MAENQGKSPVAAREEEILKFWKERDIFKKTLAKPSPRGEFVFYEGPPTANGRPGIHHLESRAFKDAVMRYKVMCGYQVRRKNGWDTHGLPVELEVEKEIGSKSKKDIEAFGIAKFNAKCKESVLRYIDEWQIFSDRIAFWAHDPYFTFDNAYIESVWNILKRAHERKLLYKDYKVVPWCPRCGTALSSHEVAQGYQDDTPDPSAYVKFKIRDKNEYLLAWTTTPWTLPGNVALAVGEDVDYAKINVGGDYVWIAKARIAAVAPNAIIVEEKKGQELVGLSYEELFPYMKQSLPHAQEEALAKAYKVYPADFVSTEDGTGIVHTAVMYGADDFELGTEIGLPKYHMVGEDGQFLPAAGPLAGMFFKHADEWIEKDLADRGLLFNKFGEKIHHTYPFCWRCKTPLMYYADTSWYIAMSRIKNDLIKENETINWEPSHIRDGRFGEWLKDLKDWAISRSRYWGTPLPIWECEQCKSVTVVGSVAELQQLAGNVPDDLHRPAIDEPRFSCWSCHGPMSRVPEVLDVWFDSGAMPFAQDHYPMATNTISYPADYICEAIDQTRGWFYTLHAVGNIMGRGKAFKNVICLGHVLDAKGKKMSKSLGNIVVPSVAIEKYGVDALRYFMYTVNAPGESKNFDERLVDEIVKKNIGRLSNVLSFYQLYADATARSRTSTHVLDMWILARLNELIAEATNGYEQYQLDSATRPLAKFIDDLSVWYLRRSRDRFKEDGADKTAALATLRFVLYNLSLVMAPAMPFFAEFLFQAVRDENDPESVHLESWLLPAKKGFFERLFGAKEEKILLMMEATRRVVSEALEAREKAGIKVRQPLASLTIQQTRFSPNESEYLKIMKDEVNVKEILFADVEQVALDTTLTPQLQEEGIVRETIRSIQQYRKEQGMKPGEPGTYAVAENVDVARKYKEHIEKATHMTLQFE